MPIILGCAFLLLKVWLSCRWQTCYQEERATNENVNDQAFYRVQCPSFLWICYDGDLFHLFLTSLDGCVPGYGTGFDKHRGLGRRNYATQPRPSEQYYRLFTWPAVS